MNFTPEELSARLKIEGESAEAFFLGLAPAQWDQPVYDADGVWRVRDLLAHFIVAEKGFHDLIQNVASGGPGAPENYPIDETNRRTVTEAPPEDALVLIGEFAMARERTVALVRALSAAQLAHQGRHPFVGQSTLNEMIRAIYHHNSLHLRDAKRALRAAGSAAAQAGLTAAEEGG